jgi:Tol biopolymer transport system component
MEFGKNRVQYKPIEWSFYRYEKMDVYFYSGGKELSKLTAQTAHAALKEYEQLFDYTLENRLQLLIFDRLSDLKQSNVGLGGQSSNNLGGTTRMVGNKVLLYYENSTASFVEQIRSGVAESVVNEFMLGSDFRQRLRSATLLNIPDWYQKGLVAWMSRPWNARIDNQVRDGIMTGRFLKFNRISVKDAEVVGESIWHYIAATYGTKVIPDIVEMTRVSRSVENGLELVLGIGLKSLTQEWINYYDRRYYNNDEQFKANKGSLISGKYRDGFVYRQAKLSKDGRYLAWVRNEYGKNILWLSDLQTGKKKKLFRVGKKLPTMNDMSYPVITWHPNGELLVYCDEHKGRLRLNFYSLKDGTTERKFLDQVQKVMSLDVSPNGKHIAMVALKDGRNDLFLFSNIANTFTPITRDEWDEANPQWMPDGERIIFSSNRSSDSINAPGIVPAIPPHAHDLFMARPFEKEVVFRRLTQTPFINEQQAIPSSNTELSYLSDANGIINRYVAHFDSSIAFVDTITHYRYFMVERPASNYKQGIIEHSADAKGQFAEIIEREGKPMILLSWMDSSFAEKSTLPPTSWAQQFKPNSTQKESPNNTNKNTGGSKVRKIVVFGEDKNKLISGNPLNGSALPDSFKLSRQRVYETAYYPDYLVTQLDRGFLNQTYQPFTGNGYQNPSINGLFRIGLSDLFEDYRITGGVRLAGNLTGNEYLLAFQSMKKRLDRTILFHRQGIQSNLLDGTRVLMHTVSGKLSYPISEVARVDGLLAYRNDRTVYLATELANLSRKNTFAHWGQVKAEFVFDNTFPQCLNMMTGTRLKVTAEHFHRLDIGATSVSIIGADVRHYIRLTRETIWATRLAGATSFGPNKVIFYLGGIDGWFTPKYDQTLAADPKQNYIFQTIGTNVRGFYQNIRNGSSFAVFNTELRWNVVKYLFKYPLKSDFLNNLQLVGFADAGTAFTGPSPYSDANTFNQKTIENGPIKVIIKNQREPIVAGFGMGLRTKLLGYYVRLDMARGLEDGTLLPSLFYLSFTTDF